MNVVATRPRVSAPDIVLGVGGLVLGVSQLVTPRLGTTTVLASITVLGLAVCAYGAAWRAWGPAAATSSLCFIAIVAFGVEILGSRTGVPFGTYAYTGRLVPHVAAVPLIVPLAWFGMGLAAWGTAAWITTHRWLRIGLGALALTAWDVFLDPQMVRAGFWEWADPGRWAFRGIPLVNYLGWFLTSLVVMAIIASLVGNQRSVPLLGLYSWMAVMHTIGFVVFFDDAIVGAAGAFAMVPFALAGWRGWSRRA